MLTMRPQTSARPSRLRRRAVAAVLATALIAACAPRAAADQPAAGDQDATPTTQAPSAEPATGVAAWGNDDPNSPQPDHSPLGRFNLWEDFEGGRVCPIELENARTIGGYTFVFDDSCLKALNLPDAMAWFPAEDGAIVIIDGTRKILVRLAKQDNGDYYAQRQVVGLENLNLTRP